jgi:hypothetical protein
MSTTYTRWINHGESIDVHVLEESVQPQDDNANSLLSEDTSGDGLDRMLREHVSSEHVNDDGHNEGTHLVVLHHISNI